MELEIRLLECTEHKHYNMFNLVAEVMNCEHCMPIVFAVMIYSERR